MAASVAALALVPVDPGMASEQSGHPATVRDRVWVCTNSEIVGSGAPTLNTYAEAGPRDRAELLNIPNVLLGGLGMPNDHDSAVAITRAAASAKRLIWKVTVDGELVTSGKLGRSPHAWYDQRMAQVRGLVDRFPRIHGLIIDDLSTVGLRGGIEAGHIRNLRSLLPAPYDRLHIWGELYTESLRAFLLRPGANDYGLTEALRALDVIVLTEWNAADLLRLQENVTHCRRLFPDQELLLNIVLYDYHGHRRMPLSLLKYQCDMALRLLRAGQVRGILVSAAINDPDALGWMAAWLQRVGDQPLSSPVDVDSTPSAAPDPAALPGPTPHAISRIYFMYHPICWSMQMIGDVPGPQIPKPHDVFLATFKREVSVVERQMRFMNAMKPDDVLVLFPNGYSHAMFIIEQYATEVLGRRCIIIRNVHPDVPAAWHTLEDPVTRLLEDPTLEGRDQWLQGIPEHLVEELFDELRRARAIEGLEFGLPAVEVAFVSRIFAHEIREQCRRRNMHFDGDTVVGEAFGEGFEECAMTWKQMLVPYLGIKGPVPNRYDLSVSGAAFLLHATPRERLALAHDIFLYLWEDEDGGPIGLFARGRCRITDPPYRVTVKIADPAIEVWGFGGGVLYPGPDSSLQPIDGTLMLNVYSAIRRGPDGLYYLRGGPGATYAQFRKSLLEAPLTW